MDKIMVMGEKPVKVLKFFDPSEVHISAYLTQISKMYRNNALIWDQLFPRFPVKNQKDKIPVYGVEHLMRVGTLRKPKTESNGVIRHLGTAIEYLCEGHALHDDVGPDERANADPPILADIGTTEFITSLLELAFEFWAYDLITTTSGYSSSSFYRTLAAGEGWNEYDSADSEPLEDIEGGIDAIKDATGKTPNTIMLPYKVARRLSKHPHLKDEKKYTDPKLLQTGGLPPVLKDLRVVIADSIYNTTMQGQSASLSPIWGDYVWIGFVNAAMGLKDTTWGLTFDRGGRIVRQWFENKIKADRIEVEEQGIDMQIFDNKLGYLLIDTLK